MVKKTLSGDKTAFNRLVAKYQTRVYGLAVNLSRSFSDAEDLAQEAFLRAYLSLHQLREPAKFGNWLYKITQNVCWRWLEKKTNHEEITERIRMNGMEKHVPEPDELAEVKELKERVRNAIDALPEQERLFVTLYYMDGLTQHDIADFVGVSESTVKRRLRSSKKKLEGELLIMVQEDLQKRDLTSEFTDKVAFKIDTLEEAIRKKIGKPEGPILKSDLEGLAKLEACKKNIHDLSGIEHCANLQTLDLDGNQITDLTPLSNMTNLRSLWLTDNQINDLGPMSKLTNLQELFIWNNQISDLSPLNQLINLHTLYLYENPISDLSPLNQLINLQVLFLGNNHLGNNQISDISPLDSLTNLRDLALFKNQISDISPLRNLTNLQELCLGENQISDISPLSSLTKLYSLDLANNSITDISVLALLRNIGKSYGGLIALIEGNEIPIHLGLSNNRISDISPLVNNSGIGEKHAIDLRGNPLSNSAYSVHIPTLQKRGVKVLFDSHP